MADLLYHMVPKATWEHCVSTNTPYYPPTYQADGFIHLTKEPHLLLVVANHFYKEPRDNEWIVVGLDAAKLTAEVKFEPAAPVGDKETMHKKDDGPLFPHLYGTINFDALVRTWPMQRDASTGEFLKIEGLEA